MTDVPSPTVDDLLTALERDFGDSLRSCVEYTPTSERIHFVREDIEQESAGGRLVRIKQLYQAERLNATPIATDAGLNRLHVSIHLFDGAVVVHLIDPGGAVVGFSLDYDALPEVTALTQYVEAAFGDVPGGVDTPE